MSNPEIEHISLGPHVYRGGSFPYKQNMKLCFFLCDASNPPPSLPSINNCFQPTCSSGRVGCDRFRAVFGRAGAARVGGSRAGASPTRALCRRAGGADLGRPLAAEPGRPGRRRTPQGRLALVYHANMAAACGARRPTDRPNMAATRALVHFGIALLRLAWDGAGPLHVDVGVVARALG